MASSVPKSLQMTLNAGISLIFGMALVTAVSNGLVTKLAPLSSTCEHECAIDTAKMNRGVQGTALTVIGVDSGVLVVFARFSNSSLHSSII
ncbi:hypothetical protein BDN71DRAFT_739158 [Pleurotus eryngii]|uniref:Uncharacterized protein n=1 Tax=Pleurotus eryngii TaxID=5323 RepID=A0A9P6DHJ9_PLEER|nr:hypothetical protein BDN71DRAFT_739158 [Pleurotus eryngii]